MRSASPEDERHPYALPPHRFWLLPRAKQGRPVGEKTFKNPTIFAPAPQFLNWHQKPPFNAASNCHEPKYTAPASNPRAKERMRFRPGHGPPVVGAFFACALPDKGFQWRRVACSTQWKAPGRRALSAPQHLAARWADNGRRTTPTDPPVRRRVSPTPGARHDNPTSALPIPFAIDTVDRLPRRRNPRPGGPTARAPYC